MTINTAALHQLRDHLIARGIHVTQVEDGFDLSPDAGFQRDPGVYSIAHVYPQVMSSLKLFTMRYDTQTCEPMLTRQAHKCNPAVSEKLLPPATIKNIEQAIAYIDAALTRVSNFLHQNSLREDSQNRATLLALASYKCTNHNDGNIAILPDCRYSGRVYEDVYIPFLRLGMPLSTIVLACATRSGKISPVTSMMANVPVRFTASVAADVTYGLRQLDLGIYR